MGSSGKEDLSRMHGKERSDTDTSGEYTPNQRDRDLPSVGSLNEVADNRDYPATVQHLRDIELQRQSDKAFLLRIKQLGDKGLQAAMHHLKGEQPANSE